MALNFNKACSGKILAHIQCKVLAPMLTAHYHEF